MREWTSLVELLRERADARPDHPVYRFLTDSGEEILLTCGELDRLARGIAARLQALGAAGERALLLYPPGLEFVAAFFGCLYAGAIAVPAYPPRNARGLPRLLAIAADARPRFVLTTSSLLPKVEVWAADIAAGGTAFPIATDDPASAEAAADWRDPGLSPDHLAFLQYTSGSTGTPKGVMVSHGNLLHNEEAIHRAFGLTERSVIVSWLPLFHDMGLVGGLLQPLYAGARCILMSPVAFLQSPVRWLQAISRFGGTTSGGPNFAYDLCARKVSEADLATLSLSSWEVAFNGAEPVRAETLERFNRAFAPAGFRPRAFFPCYGLAEATLFVSGGPAAMPPAVQRVDAAALEQTRVVPLREGVGESRAATLVSSGQLWPEQRVVIADPETGAALPAGRVGEIWVAGASIAKGYWGKAEVSERTFGARLPDGTGPFLRTGDLGFDLGGELYVTGRLKDLLIIRGRNLYPQDIERTVEVSHPELRAGCGAAFAVEIDGEERLVVAYEVERHGGKNPEAIGEAVRRAVAEEHEIQVHDLVLLRTGTVPKTSSGKIQRHACRAGYLAGSLEEVGRSTLGGSGQGAGGQEALAGGTVLDRASLTELPEGRRQEALVADLRSRVARLLRVASAAVDPAQPLTGLGLDSLTAVELQSGLEGDLGLSVSMARLLEGASIAELAGAVLEGLDGAGAEAEGHPLVPAGETVGEHPLSPGQTALWFLERLAPEAAVYNIAAAAWVRGELDPEALRRALVRLVERHPSLRTTFPTVHGEPVQRVGAETVLDFTLEQAPEEDVDLAERLAGEAHRPFDLAAGPLLRVHLLRRSATEHALLLVIHHLVADFWSVALLVAELGRLYAAERAGSEERLSLLPLRYTDWVRWQAARLEGPEGERLRAYWHERLAGRLPVLDLPTDRPRPPAQTWRGAERALRVAPGVAGELEALGRRRGATLFMTVLAAFQTLLHRYTGHEDVLVGSPAAGRSRPEVRELVGYFVGPLVLRGDLTGDPPFLSFLDRVRRVALEAFDHAEYPFEKIVEGLQPERDPSRSPIFQVLFTLQSAPPFAPPALAAFALGTEGGADADLSIPLGDLALQPLPVERRNAPFDLSLQAALVSSGLALALQYNTDLFDAGTAERMLGHLGALLEGIARQPEMPLSALPLLTGPERRQILEDWNDTRMALPEVARLERLFEIQAERVPDNPAVSFEGRTWTYAELNERADRLAARLRALGVGPDVPVALCVERSLEMVEGLLGVLKAGGAYVPLDPAYPRERLAYMLEDAWAGVGRPVLLTQESLREAMAELAGERTQVIALDDAGGGALSREAGEGWGGGLPENHPDHLAYVIYTSGSTGRPKGVQISHRAVVNFLLSMAGRPGFSEGDTLLAVTTLSFDIAGLELYLPLITGARVVLASRESVLDGVRLAQLLADSGASVMQATPATWRLLLESGWNGREGLRIFCGGEGLPRDLADRLLRCGAALWNLYGPTETTIWSAAGDVISGDSGVPVGQPIANTQVYVLDRHLAPVPAGIPGEVYIGGTGLARGYFHRPDLTADRFGPDPFSAKGERLYRVGDLGRWRADGRLEILGRVDHQVKVRGFRIELGEIEAALAAHPEVKEAVVVAREDTPGDRRLVAYVVPAPGAAGAAGMPDLRGFLAERLPGYMVPSHVVAMEAFPLTPNGKVDRRALPAPSGAKAEGPARTEPGALPRTELERTLAAVWAEVLGIERVGVDDNFFDLGGHSLLVARVHARLRETLGRDDLTMVDLFRHPTVRSLARFLAPAEAAAQMVAAPVRRERTGAGFAIVGMACRFPGAPDVDAFWNLLRGGGEAVTFFSPEELRAAGVSAEMLADPSYVPARAVLQAGEEFDAAFFGFTPREAEVMEPQHRVFLEVSWEALEHAGYDSSRYPGRIGVFAGVGLNTYLLQARRELLEAAGSYQAFLGNDKDFVPTRVSYKLNLRGPSINVQTACSSSLVALHLACQSLALGESDMALAGGVSIRVPQTEGYVYQAGGILSPDGRCRAFDERAGGTVFGSGSGVVVVKRLEDAVADGDRIWAVVRGTALNNDGSGKIGYTAPSVEGQAQVIQDALSAAGVGPETVTYVEAHGTGTELGDPIEVSALKLAFANGAERKLPCALGSVKTNVGHLDTAAGVAGLIKTALALTHREIPPSLNFERPNPALRLDEGPFQVAAALAPWETEGQPRRAGVSSFGIGGTNAHAVLEEAPASTPAEETVSAAGRSRQLLVLSARTPTALEAATSRLADFLARNPEINLADVAWTLQAGRRGFEHRRIAVVSDAREAAAVLAAGDPERLPTAVCESGERPVVFLFSGQGSQYPGMGRGLYEEEPVFRAAVDRCAEILAPELGLDLRELLFPAEGTGPEEAAARLEETRYTQPALFTVEYALARLWEERGVRPAAMLGHSIGEYVAACLAGVFSLEDALALVAERGRLMQSMPGGVMLAVQLPEKDLAALLPEGLSLAAVNGPSDCVAAGTAEAVEELERRLAGREIQHRRLHTSHAFHSALMEPAVAPFVERVRRVALQVPRRPYLSNLTGDWITAEQAMDPAYWGAHLRGAVRFADGVAKLFSDSASVGLEVGPGRALATLAKQTARGRTVVTSLPHPRDKRPDAEHAGEAVGKLWLAGVEIDWKGYHGQARRRVALPTYPFERKRYFIESRPEAPVEPARDPLARRADLADWFSVPVWKGAPLAPRKLGNGSVPSFLVIGEPGGIGERLAERLREGGAEVRVVRVGEEVVPTGGERIIWAASRGLGGGSSPLGGGGLDQGGGQEGGGSEGQRGQPPAVSFERAAPSQGGGTRSSLLPCPAVPRPGPLPARRAGRADRPHRVPLQGRRTGGGPPRGRPGRRPRAGHPPGRAPDRGPRDRCGDASARQR